MQLFRKLAGNIFFKIILAFVALTFVLFGVSGFILGNPNSWVLKIGGTSIGHNAFNKAMQNDRSMILNSTKNSEDAMKYVESDQFKSDVLGRMVNKAMIEKLHKDMGTQASKQLILEGIAKDQNFRKDGKFDHETFKKFLTQNGLNEERYVNEIANEITATMVIQTIALAAPMNDKFIMENDHFKQEKRLADVVTISLKNVGNVAAPSEQEIHKFFAENKQQYALPEMRKVSYIHFSRKDFAKEMQISEAEIAAEYEQNKAQFAKPESRSFYHVLFEDEKAAKSFLEKINNIAKADKSKLKPEFIQLAKEVQNKDLKAITINNIFAKDLIPELSQPLFKLNVDENSDVLKSPLGFHIFLLTDVKKSQPMSLAEVKGSIKKQLLEGREEKVVQAKISAIDDALLTTNSLTEVAKKFNLATPTNPVKIDHSGQNDKGAQVTEIAGLEGFSANSFALAKGQVSKIFYAKNSEGYYAIKVEDVELARERELSEVKAQVIANIAEQNKINALQKLVQTISAELKTNPQNAAQIAAKYKVKFEKNREFPRIFYINLQGRKMPYQNKFLDELFSLKIGEATSAIPAGAQEFAVGILREIKSQGKIDSNQFAQAKQEAAEAFKTEILQEFNKSLLAKYPVQVNEKLLGGSKEKEVQEIQE